MSLRKRLLIFNPFGTLLTCKTPLTCNTPVFTKYRYQTLFGSSPKVTQIFNRGQDEVNTIRKRLGFYLEKPHHRFNYREVESHDGKLSYIKGDGPPELQVDPKKQAETLFEMNLSYMEYDSCIMLPDVDWEIRDPRLVTQMMKLTQNAHLVALYHHVSQLYQPPPCLFDTYLGSPFTKEALLKMADDFDAGPADIVLVNQGDPHVHDIARDLDVALLDWGSQIFTFEELVREVELL